MSKLPVFEEGELVREIGLLGLSQKEFAAEAGVNEKIVTRAVQGKPLRAKSFGKILIALGRLANRSAQEVAS